MFVGWILFSVALALVGQGGSTHCNANKGLCEEIKDSEDCIPGVVHWRESLLLFEIGRKTPPTPVVAIV